MLSPIAVILNASAGAEDKQALARQLESSLAQAGVQADVTLAQNSEDFGQALRAAVERSPQAIVAGGGDGTINAVATALMGTGMALGVLPLGTLNHFAKDLKIPLDLQAAIQCIIAGHTMQVDVGQVNDRYFLNNSSLGIYPHVVRNRERQQRTGRHKWVAFFWAVLAVLRRHIFLRVSLTAGGVPGDPGGIRKTPFVFVGNNEYEMEGLNLGTRGCLNAGQLSVHSLKKTGRLSLLSLALRSLFGRLQQSRDYDAFCAPEVRIESGHAQMLVSTDGEVTMMKMPLHYAVRPGALRVIVPAGVHGEP